MNFYPQEQPVFYNYDMTYQQMDLNQQFVPFPQQITNPQAVQIQVQLPMQQQLQQQTMAASQQQFDYTQNLSENQYYYQNLNPNVNQNINQQFLQQQQFLQSNYQQQDFYPMNAINNVNSIPNMFSYNENLNNSSMTTINSMNEMPKSPLSPISDISLPLETFDSEHKELMSSPVKLASQKFMFGNNSLQYSKLQLPSPIDEFQFNQNYNNLRKNSAPLPYKISKRKSTSSLNYEKRRNSSIKSDHTSQPGPIPASPPELIVDLKTGEELLTFFYSKQKIITQFTIKCPNKQQEETMFKDLPVDFLNDNCIYPRAMVPESEYKGNRGSYERECNKLGWQLSWLNPEIRNQRGLIQRAVDSWRNTRDDVKIRSRRVRKQAKLNKKQQLIDN